MCALLVATSVAGCSKVEAQELIAETSTFIEGRAQGTLHWNVDDGGVAQLAVKNEEGQLLKQGVTGQLVFNTGDEAPPTTVKLQQDKDTGVLVAEGPELSDAVTEVRYALLVDGRPWTGALHLPESGTRGLVKAAEDNEQLEEAKGPEGGTIQVVDGQRYEVVADADSGETRVYVIDGPKPKELKLAVDVEPPRQVALKLHPDGYYAATLGVETVPRKITLVVVDNSDEVHLALVGYRPGVVINEHPRFWVRRGWHHRGLARGHHKGTRHGPPGHYKHHKRHKHRDIVVARHGGKSKHKHK